MTFFFNGGVEEPNEGEDRILVPSPKEVATYDLKPEMSANGVCDKLVEAIKSGKYDVIIINFANPDMVGHTGVGRTQPSRPSRQWTPAWAVQWRPSGKWTVSCLSVRTMEMRSSWWTMRPGEPFTAHTTNPVPFILVNADPSCKLREGGALCDIVPTLIELMGMEQPKEMTGKSLLVK